MTSRSRGQRSVRPAVTDLLHSLCSMHAKDEGSRLLVISVESGLEDGYSI